jgi:biopolymer transport protein ExbD
MGTKKRGDTAEELNLVPIMNLVTILIPFLLMAAQFVSYAVIDSTLPAISAQPSEPQEEPDEKPLNLSIMITRDGFTVTGNHAELAKAGGGEEGESKGSNVPCVVPGCSYDSDGGEGPAEAYDVAGLRALLGRIKDDKPEEKTVILVPDSGVPYEVLVMAMDSTREDPDSSATKDSDGSCMGRCLFPFVVIAGGVMGGE